MAWVVVMPWPVARLHEAASTFRPLLSKYIKRVNIRLAYLSAERPVSGPHTRPLAVQDTGSLGKFMQPDEVTVQFVWQPYRDPAEFAARSSREGSIPSREI
ncbi:hypothetical protein ABIB66_008519 [Bradyrhizobium sp. F1.13.3]